MPIDNTSQNKTNGNFQRQQSLKDQKNNKQVITSTDNVDNVIIPPSDLINHALILAKLLLPKEHTPAKHVPKSSSLKRSVNTKKNNQNHIAGSPIAKGRTSIEVIRGYSPADKPQPDKPKPIDQFPEKLPQNELQTNADTTVKVKVDPSNSQLQIQNPPPPIDFTTPFMAFTSIAHQVALRDQAPLNIVIANEAYEATKISLQNIIQKNFIESDSLTKQEIARNILCKTSMGFDHNFLHLISIPVVDDSSEISKYKSLLETVRDFIIKSEISYKEVFSYTDSNNNNLLHTMATLGSQEQFKIFLENFKDLIPQELWYQKNQDGYNPLDILNSEEILKKSIVKISEAIGVDSSVSSKSPSDILLKEITNSRKYCNANAVIPEGFKDSISAYPLGIFKCQSPNQVVAVDPLTNEVLETFSNKQFKEIEPYLIDSLTYSQQSINDRLNKLQEVEKIVPQIKPISTSTLSSIKLEHETKQSLTRM